MPDPAGAGRRLLWIHQNFVSAKQTGISRAVYFLAALEAAGWTVDVVCSRSGYLDEAQEQDLSDNLLESAGGLTLHRLGQPRDISTMKREDRGRSYFSFNDRALKYIAANLPPADVIWTSSPPLTICLPAIQLALKWRVPLLFEVRDLWPMMLIETHYIRNPIVIAIMEIFEVLALGFADHIIPVAPGFQRYYELMGIPASRITTIPTGGDPYFLGATPARGLAWRREHGLEDRVIVLFSGSMNETSNVATLAKAAELSASKHPEVVWLFAGNGRQKDAVLAVAAQHPDNVRYLGALPRDAMLPLFAAADLSVTARVPDPMEKTVYPGKLFDALASGVPVLTNHPGQPSIVLEEARCGIVLDGSFSPELFVEGLERLLAMAPAEREAMGRRGQEWLLREMNAFRMGEELVQLLDRDWPRRSLPAQFWRLVCATLQGIGWTLTRRQRRAHAQFAGADAIRIIREAFDAWPRRPHPAPARPPDYTLPTPSILSSREA